MDKNVKSNRNPHLNLEMKEYVMGLWMKGVSPHVINRLIAKKLGYSRRPDRDRNDNRRKVPA